MGIQLQMFSEQPTSMATAAFSTTEKVVCFPKFCLAEHTLPAYCQTYWQPLFKPPHQDKKTFDATNKKIKKNLDIDTKTCRSEASVWWHLNAPRPRSSLQQFTRDKELGNNSAAMLVKKTSILRHTPKTNFPGDWIPTPYSLEVCITVTTRSQKACSTPLE